MSPQCILCFQEIIKKYETFLVKGKAKFNVFLEIQSLPFTVDKNSDYICRVCLQRLKKRRGILSQLQEIENLFQSYQKKDISLRSKRSSGHGGDDCPTPTKSPCLHQEIPVLSSSPTRAACTAIPRLPVSPILKHPRPQNKEVQVENKANVTVKVQWPSKDATRKLPQDLESLGKMLVRGTYKQIANAVWKNDSIRKELTSLVLRDVEKEVTNMCSKKDPSCLRSTDMQSMLSLTMEKVSDEVEERAPLFFSFLSTACINRNRRRTSVPKHDFAAIAMAASICLRNRSRNMLAVQLLITTFLYHSNWMSTLARLGPVRLTTSHTFLYKKLEEYGKHHDKDIRDAVLLQSQYMKEKKTEGDGTPAL